MRSGVFAANATPALALQVDASHRPVLEVHPRQKVSASASASASAAAASGQVDVRFVIDFDYPLTVFLAFAIVCALEALRQDREDAK